MSASSLRDSSTDLLLRILRSRESSLRPRDLSIVCNASETLRIITLEKDSIYNCPKTRGSIFPRDLYLLTDTARQFLHDTIIFRLASRALAFTSRISFSNLSRSTSRMNQPPVLTPPADKQGNLATMIQKKNDDQTRLIA